MCLAHWFLPSSGSKLLSLPYLPGSFSATALLNAVTPSLAIDCEATGGHLDGQEAWIVRHVTLGGDQMVLTNDFGDRHVVTCKPLSPGLWCQGTTGALDVVVIAHGLHLLESIADRRSEREHAGLSYLCDQPLEAQQQ